MEVLVCEIDGWVLGGMQFGVLLARTVACNGSWLVYHHDVVNHVMMLLQLLRCCIMVRGCGGGRMLSTSGCC